MSAFGHLVIDIEAASIADAEQYLEPASAPANYKDEAKIAAYIAEANQQALSKCALDPDLARIVALGMCDPQTGVVDVLTANSEASEGVLLTTLWERLRGQVTVIGYNVTGYDLPVLMRRSLYLGVTAPQIQIDKYRHPTVIDLMQVLSYNGAMKYRGLAFYLKRFGIPHTDTTTGADIGALVSTGDWAAIEAHCRADVEATVALARRIGVIQAQPEMAAR